MRGQWRVIRPSDNIARMKFRIRPILAVSLVLLWLFDQSLLFLCLLVPCDLAISCDFVEYSLDLNPCRFFGFTVRLFSLISLLIWNILIFGSTDSQKDVNVCDLCNEQSSFYITDMKDLYEWSVFFIGGTSSLEVYLACLQCCVLLSCKCKCKDLYKYQNKIYRHRPIGQSVG